ncbi:MAG: hypothetical protein IME96_10230 [Proteobacteria bacterium]|nr:hypothetical protein [Pseudomonadota bacterium]
MNEQTQISEKETQRSTFITVLAWIFIIMGGFASIISLLQNIMIFFVFPGEDMKQLVQQGSGVEQAPALIQFFFTHMDLIFFALFIVALTTFISAVSLLKRKDWARKVFIGLMLLAITWNLLGVIVQYSIFSSMPGMMVEAAPTLEYEIMMTVLSVIKAVTMIIAVILCILFGWIIKKLGSTRIRAEFT